MRLFDLFGKDRIQPAWEYRAKGWLWYIRPTNAGTIVGEERDPDRKEATFFCINSDTGQVLWQNESFGDRWWTGVEAVHRDMLFLHGFAAPDMPQHRGITAVDLFTGKQLWARPDLRFAGAADDRLLAAEGPPAAERLVFVSRATGTTEAPVETAAASGFTDESALLEEMPSFSVPLETAAAADPSLEPVVRAWLAETRIAGPIGVLVVGSRLVLSYHEHVNFPDQQEPLYNNILLIVDRTTGKDLYSMVLDNGLRNLVPESFFVQHQRLYCIRDRRVLVAVPLEVPHDPSAS